MKTIRSFYKYVLAIILMMSGAQTLQAQDAFYIYRNDGDFDGFFYDQIVRMGYSKTDLEGEEHDVYVVQEIETKDSLYRIPLAAIDSIGFQQPEIRLNPKLKVINTCGLQPYLQSADMRGMTVYFQNLPTALIPQKGDILVGYDDGDETSAKYYGDNSFGGVVTDYQIVDNITMVYCDHLSDFSQVFDQLISVEQVGADSQGNARRRIAGFNEDGSLSSAPRKLNGNFNVSLIDWAGRLTLAEDSDPNVKLSIGIDIGINVKATFVYAITGIVSKRFFVKSILSESLSAGLSGEAKVYGEKMWECDVLKKLAPAIKFPAFLPIFEIAPYPKGFFQIHGELVAKFTLPSFSLGMSQTLTIDTDDPWIVSAKWGNRDKQPEGFKVVESDFSWIKAGVSFTGWLYAGSNLPLELATNSWISKLIDARIGMEMSAGPKLSASMNINFTDPDYDYMMLKDSKIEFDVFNVSTWAGFTAKVLDKEEKKRTIWETEKKYFSSEWFLFPDFTDHAHYNVLVHKEKLSDGNYSERREITSIDYTVYPRRQVIVSLDLGVALYKMVDGNYKLVETFWYDKKYSFTNNYVSYTINIPCRGRSKGVYSFKPILRYNDEIVHMGQLSPTQEEGSDYCSFTVDEDGYAWD